MKKIVSIITLLFIGSITSYAQINTDPTTGNVGIGTTNPDTKLSIYKPSGGASYPTSSSSGDIFLKLRGNNNGFEFGNSVGYNDRKAWILARHTTVSTYGNFYSTLHIQPSVGDDTYYRGVAIGYTASTQLPIGTHLAVSGNVGIGTTTPQAGLHIVNNTGVFIDDTVNGFPGRISMSDGFTNTVNIAKDDFLFESDGAFIFKLDRNGNGISNLPGFGVYDKNNKSIFFAKDNGNVGIGTTNPQEKLDIKGSMSLTSGGDLPFKIWAGGSGSSNHMRIGTDYGHSGDAALEIYQNYKGGNQQKPGKVIVNGNLGIGTTIPSEKLHVEGNLLLDAYQLGDQSGIFFRDGFSKSNKYNLSILTHNDGDNSADALDINAYDGVYFNTGSNNRNPRMMIAGNGNVGIGTINPAAKLHVTEGVQLRKTTIGLTKATADNSWIRDEWLTGSYGPAKWNQDKKKWVRPSGPYNDIGGIVYQDEGTYFLREGLGTKLEYTNSEFLNTAYMFAQINTGNVGIGTNTPEANLEVSSANDGDAILRIEADEDNNNESDNPMIQFRQDGGQLGINMGFSEENFGGNIFGIGTRYTNQESWNALAIDTQNGNVGIGTTDTKGYKLGVNGKIAATEVKVALYNDWPDYVFEEAYKLPALEEVEQHISEKGHLSNIPSAIEVAENGIQLGEMNAKLLEKIEELTLYTIAQQKEIKQLQEENTNQKSMNKQHVSTNKNLEERLAKLEALLLKY